MYPLYALIHLVPTANTFYFPIWELISDITPLISKYFSILVLEQQQTSRESAAIKGKISKRINQVQTKNTQK